MLPLEQTLPSRMDFVAALFMDLPAQPGDVPPPMTPPAPIDEPEPDRLPDETPLPNPDENDNPPQSVRGADLIVAGSPGVHPEFLSAAFPPPASTDRKLIPLLQMTLGPRLPQLSVSTSISK